MTARRSVKAQRYYLDQWGRVLTAADVRWQLGTCRRLLYHFAHMRSPSCRLPCPDCAFADVGIVQLLAIIGYLQAQLAEHPPVRSRF